MLPSRISPGIAGCSSSVKNSSARFRNFLNSTMKSILLLAVSSAIIASSLAKADNRSALIVGCDDAGTEIELPSPVEDAKSINVFEWGEDWYNKSKETRVLRGGS